MFDSFTVDDWRRYNQLRAHPDYGAFPRKPINIFAPRQKREKHIIDNPPCPKCAHASKKRGTRTVQATGKTLQGFECKKCRHFFSWEIVSVNEGVVTLVPYQSNGAARIIQYQRNNPICPKCHGKKTTKQGIRILKKSRDVLQGFKCKGCAHFFSVPIDPTQNKNINLKDLGL